ncbi:hypothetical protein ATK86_0520 [Nocardia fluminea]|uniref:Uncharacterized protein n=1 Tax=Nocardia fluminea TaxID=134984 RepID=A0A2N3WXC3_9NOCA|nr:hypothetical protein ATK86_0520 [Nocardia fluminea]
MRYSDHPALDFVDPLSDSESEAAVVRWPEPSPLQSWWTEIMGGISRPSQAPTKRRRSGGQTSSRLPQS